MPQDVSFGNYLCDGFARHFTAADTHRDSIAALLVPWFAGRAVADQAAAFAGPSVSWALLRNLTGRPGSR